ncbi:Protein VAPYRIN [Phytophthora ramorum]|uniref:Protein VAPYRIN n=1 Tax=Phytophthora ramorum TaxID=164328 RepID=UPI0030AE003D|nr:Protein VAPYRIN [Phytophthora ramorum]
MSDASEVESVLASLVEAVVASANCHQEVVAQEAEVLPIGGYLWKFPSEGSNRTGSCTIHPPPAPQFREYPRRCDQCGVCWVSDRDYELDHLRRCSATRSLEFCEDTKEQAAKLGVARRVWCEVDGSISRLQWRHDREFDSEDSVTSTTSFISFTDITEVSVLNEPANSFQIVTRDDRTVVFQWRPDKALEATLGLVPYRLELNAQQWQEYLDELSKYARNSPLDERETQSTAAETIDKAVVDEISRLLLSEREERSRQALENRLCSMLELSGYSSQCLSSLCDVDGNSLLHLAISLNLGEHSATTTSMLLQMGLDCNMQNHEEESPLLLVAASGDLAAARVLLDAPLIQVDLPCALGVTAFHAAANAGDVKMMQLLCDSGAQPEVRDGNGWTALHYAAACSTGLEALHFLCELLNDGFIDAQCSEGNTALHVAAGCGCLENVRALLETAASPHVYNFSGERAYHVALCNNHIQCAVAINDYQSMPVTTYTAKPSSPAKESAVLEATAVLARELSTRLNSQGEGGKWIEVYTEDGYAYYYNTVTGESSWYKPGECHLPDSWDIEYEEHESGINDKLSENDVSHSYALSADHNVGSILGEGAGQQLPVCLIPMVSPLTSLDNPTAAAKYEAARRKARKQRKRRHSKAHLAHNRGGNEDAPVEWEKPPSQHTVGARYQSH